MKGFYDQGFYDVVYIPADIMMRDGNCMLMSSLYWSLTSQFSAFAFHLAVKDTEGTGHLHFWPKTLIFITHRFPLTSMTSSLCVWSYALLFFLCPDRFLCSLVPLCRVQGKRKGDSCVRVWGWPVKVPLFPVLSFAKLTSSSWSAAYVWTATKTLKYCPACTPSVKGEWSYWAVNFWHGTGLVKLQHKSNMTVQSPQPCCCKCKHCFTGDGEQCCCMLVSFSLLTSFCLWHKRETVDGAWLFPLHWLLLELLCCYIQHYICLPSLYGVSSSCALCWISVQVFPFIS